MIIKSISHHYKEIKEVEQENNYIKGGSEDNYVELYIKNINTDMNLL